jgi:hypothetical protein
MRFWGYLCGWPQRLVLLTAASFGVHADLSTGSGVFWPSCLRLALHGCALKCQRPISAGATFHRCLKHLFEIRCLKHLIEASYYEHYTRAYEHGEMLCFSWEYKMGKTLARYFPSQTLKWFPSRRAECSILDRGLSAPRNTIIDLYKVWFAPQGLVVGVATPLLLYRADYLRRTFRDTGRLLQVLLVARHWD